ncbi:hypothetical protein HanXRQr2_Chr17g0824251 [Helianthus annuus]|uniref:Uncharacterized protein n=1 Tax=Helianthus annuus TaxID=4232 RepID=A0A9K3GW49_HELAN|nr:hypothetical protein HanXRQr2_Chr17g0824251 [Helianthus annuus]
MCSFKLLSYPCKAMSTPQDLIRRFTEYITQTPSCSLNCVGK